MGAHARHRVRFFQWPVTSIYYNLFTGSVTRTMHAYDQSVCDDVVGNYPNPNGLGITRFRSQPGIISGVQMGMYNGQYVIFKKVDGFPIGFAPNSLALGAGNDLPGLTEQNSVSLKTKASTNPSKPIWSTPTMLAELKDIPGLVRSWGRRVLRWRESTRFWRDPRIRNQLIGGASDAHLTYQWVIRPMVSDLTKMLNYANYVKNRVDQLQRLRTKRLVRGRGAGSNSLWLTSTSVVIESQVDIIIANRAFHHSRATWGSCNWTLNSSATSIPSLEIDQHGLNRAEQLVAGITSYETLQAAWELMPWSWFVDWFTGVGTAMSAHNNTIDATAGNFCIMCERRCKTSYHVTYKPAWLQFVAGFEEYSWKWRVSTGPPAPVSLSTLPLFDTRKLSILGALFALKSGHSL